MKYGNHFRSYFYLRGLLCNKQKRVHFLTKLAYRRASRRMQHTTIIFNILETKALMLPIDYYHQVLGYQLGILRKGTAGITLCKFMCICHNLAIVIEDPVLTKQVNHHTKIKRAKKKQASQQIIDKSNPKLIFKSVRVSVPVELRL